MKKIIIKWGGLFVTLIIVAIIPSLCNIKIGSWGFLGFVTGFTYMVIFNYIERKIQKRKNQNKQII